MSLTLSPSVFVCMISTQVRAMIAFVYPQGDWAPDCNCICRQSTWMPAALIQLASCATDGVNDAKSKLPCKL